MDIKDRLYPHPVLYHKTDDYVRSSFDAEVKVSESIRKIVIEVRIHLDNRELTDLIEQGKAEYLLHIECPYTSYRQIIKSSSELMKKEIPNSLLDGKVSVCLFIVAKQDLKQYKNTFFNEDYGDSAFDLEKGSIMAISGQWNITVTKDSEELAKIPSIFTICRSAVDTDESVKFDIDGDKIAITLCNNSFQNYRVLSGIPTFMHVFHSMLLMPALIYVFEVLKREGTEDFETRRWYKAIKQTFKKYNMDLTKELLDKNESYELAQKLLDMPADRALTALSEMGTSQGDDTE